MATVMRKRLSLTGSTLRARSAAFKALLADEIHRTLWPRLAEGAWKPAMDQAFALTDAAAAHDNDVKRFVVRGEQQRGRVRGAPVWWPFGPGYFEGKRIAEAAVVLEW